MAVEDGDGLVRIVLDAGTGITRLSALLDGGPFVGSLLIGHLHWDHTHGLPFARALDHPAARVAVHGPGDDVHSVKELLAQAMSPPNFPIGPDELRGSWSWHTLGDGSSEVEGMSLLTREIPHKGGRTFGYRVSDGSCSFAYLSDHMPQALGPGPDGLGVRHEAAVALARGADVLLHDAQYTAEELPARGSFGHAAAEYAVALGEECGVREVVLFHHDPTRTDSEIDAIVSALRGDTSITVTAAREDLVIDVGAPA